MSSLELSNILTARFVCLSPCQRKISRGRPTAAKFAVGPLNHRSSTLSFAMDHSHPASPPPTPAKKARVDLLDPTYEPEQVGSASTSEMASQPPVVTSETSATTSGPRKIDENTDMTTLTDQEIMRLMEGMDHTEDVMTRVRPRHLSVARLTPSSH